MVGFAPGFPYLGVLPAGLHLPRRETPRPRVPPGSVAIADRLTGIYPQETPGGWHLIGWTPLRLFDPATDPPALCEPGDRVRFERNDPATTATSPNAAKVTSAGAVAGAGWQALVDGRPADPEAPLELRPGQALEFRRSGNAVWAYLAVGGGIDVPL